MRFLLVVTIMMASVALLALDMTIPHAQAASTPNCVSPIPSPVPGTPVPAPTTPGTIFINEVLTNPSTIWNCDDQSFSSYYNVWIELYNTQDQPVDLYATHTEIYMGATTGYAYPLPSPSIIAAHGFLVVFPLVASTASTISSAVVRVGTAVLDSVNIPPLQPNQSYARIPDGSSNWQVSNYPTIEASNLLYPPTPTPTPTKTPKVRVSRTKTPKAQRSSSDSSGSNQSNTTAYSTDGGTDTSQTGGGSLRKDDVVYWSQKGDPHLGNDHHHRSLQTLWK